MEGTGENIGVLEGVGVPEGSPSAAVSRRSGPPRTPGVPPPGRSSVSILGWAGVAPPAACARPTRTRRPSRPETASPRSLGTDGTTTWRARPIRPRRRPSPPPRPVVSGLDRRRVAIRPRGVWRLPRRVVPDGPATETSPRSRRVARSVSHIRARVRRRRGCPRRARLLRRSRRRRGGVTLRGGLLSRRPGRDGRAPEPVPRRGKRRLRRVRSHLVHVRVQRRESRDRHRGFEESRRRARPDGRRCRVGVRAGVSGSEKSPSTAHAPRAALSCSRRTPRAYSPPRVCSRRTVDVRRWTPTRTGTFERKPCGRCLCGRRPRGSQGSRVSRGGGGVRARRRRRWCRRR